MTNRAIGGSPVNQAASQGLIGAIGGEKVNPNYDFSAGGNPAFDAMVTRADNAIRPKIKSQFALAGRSGASSPGQTEAYSRALADAVAPLAYQSYETDRGRQFQGGEAALDRSLQGVGMAPGISALDFQDISALGQVGRERENLFSRKLQEDLARFQFAQQEPISRLGQYSGLVGGLGNLGGTVSGTSTQPSQTSTNPLLTALGVGSGLVGIGSGLFSPTQGIFPTFGRTS